MLDLLKELKDCDTVAISGHVRPDGDCIGSVMGTYLYLRKVFPEKTIIPMIEKPAPEFSVISGIDDIVTDFQPGVPRFDAFIGLDSSSPDRYGDAGIYFETAKKTIVIDHHISNEGFGDLRYIDGEASSTCELICDLMDRSLADKEIAMPLYIGIIHDTGVLQYSNVSPKTLNTVAWLIGYGFDFSKIIEETFYERTRLQNEMLGRALIESITFMDGKCIASKIDKKTMEFYGADSHAFEGIVNQLRFTKGVEVAIFMYEVESMEYKVSLRSRGLVDVAKIAKFYDGGGHARAAGFTMKGTFYDIVNNISDSIAIQLDEE
ncbi:MAG: bifunctional oligoribonuclease/PAP phosphatase NrnA [Lachnospiraceae bacterium]|nr:bifunctional oligoribonuclease/PAP phosphatase NrnA [Lachnospiraceae bacterium]